MQIELILEQHQMIRMKINSLLDRLGISKKDPTVVDRVVFDYDLKEVIQLVEAHSRCEEEILIPILVEMYSSSKELTQYIEDDHKKIEEDLANLKEINGDIQDNIREIRSILNRIIIHFEEEERGLIPLVAIFLKTKGASIA